MFSTKRASAQSSGGLGGPESSVAAQARVVPAPTDDLLTERRGTHGSYARNAEVAQLLKTFLKGEATAQLNNVQLETIDNIAAKLARAIQNPGNPDNWADIAGYARLAELDARGVLGTL